MRQPVLFDRLAHQVAAAIGSHFFFVHVGHGEVVVGGGFIHLAGRRRGLGGLRRTRQTGRWRLGSAKLVRRNRTKMLFMKYLWDSQ